MTVDPKNLIGYCGLYCGACGIYQGRITQVVKNLRKVIGAYGFDKIAPELAKWEPTLQYYAEFEKVMDGLVKLFGECLGCIGLVETQTVRFVNATNKKPTLPVQIALK